VAILLASCGKHCRNKESSGLSLPLSVKGLGSESKVESEKLKERQMKWMLI
jgi:hypothetical protein